jgi:hypothetical protein
LTDLSDLFFLYLRHIIRSCQEISTDIFGYFVMSASTVGSRVRCTITLSCCSREENTIGNAIRSRQWPFTLTNNAFMYIDRVQSKN